jgi:glutamine amidotransferase-like uncharacterized protein
MPVRNAAWLLLFSALVSCEAAAPSTGAPILVFAGNGTSAGDVAAVESILKNNHLAYATATSRQLNRMSAARMAAYRLLVVPGGNFIDMAGSLAPMTTANIRDAVEGGLNYLGICAGAFIAGDGHGHYNSLNLTSGVQFGFYSAESKGTRKAAVPIFGADLQSIEHYWEDGPELTGWGAIVGKYPDGAPAIVEGQVGKGWVILSGVHPEAPESWRRGMRFNTPASVANAYAGTLIQAALRGTALPHYSQ